MSIRHLIPAVILVGTLSLGGCASDGGLALTTGSLDTKSKPAPTMAQKPAMTAACTSLMTRIHTLRQEGTPARVEKVAAGKSTTAVVKRSALAKLTELNNANAEFLSKCSSAPSAHLRAAAAAAAAAEAAKKTAPVVKKKKVIPKKTSAAPTAKKAATTAGTTVTKKTAAVATTTTTAKQATTTVKKAVTATKEAVTVPKKVVTINKPVAVPTAPVPTVNKSVATPTVTKRVTAAAAAEAAAEAAKVTTATAPPPTLGVAFPGTGSSSVVTTTVPSGQ